MRELWQVDLGAGEVSVCRRPDERAATPEVTVKRRGESLSPEALGDVTLTVNEVLG